MKHSRISWKTFAAVLLVGLLGALSLLAILRAFYPPERCQTLARDFVEQRLGRQVSLVDAGVGFRGVTLTGLEISEDPDFSAGTFLSVETIRLRPSWKALLRGRLTLAAVEGDGLRLNVRRDADGRFNFATLLAKAKDSAPAAPALSPADFDIRRALFRNGSATYTDAAAGSRWDLTELNLSGSDLGSAPFTAGSSFRLKGHAGSREVDWKVNFESVFDGTRGFGSGLKAEVTRFDVESGGLRVSGRGALAGASPTDVEFALKATTYGKELLRLNGRAKMGDVVTAQVDGIIPDIDLEKLSRWLPGNRLPAIHIPETAVAATLTASAQRLRVDAFKASWKKGEAEGSWDWPWEQNRNGSQSGRLHLTAELPELSRARYPLLPLTSKLILPPGRWDVAFKLKNDSVSLQALATTFKNGWMKAYGEISGVSSPSPRADISLTGDLDLPGLRIAQLPFPVSFLPATLRIPASHLKGGLRLLGDDLQLKGILWSFQKSSLKFDGALKGFLTDTVRPELVVAPNLDLGPWSNADVPGWGLQAGSRIAAGRWSGEIAWTPDLLQVHSLRFKTERSDVEASGSIADPSARAALDLNFKVRNSSLAEISPALPALHELGLSGIASAEVSATGARGRWTSSGQIRGSDVGAAFAGMKFSHFNGAASFNERSIEIQNLTGQIDESEVKLTLTAKDLGRAPDIQLDAVIDRLDLGRYFAVKKTYLAAHGPAQNVGGTSISKKPALSTRGRIVIGRVAYPKATVSDVKLDWNLHGYTSDFKSLGGDVSMKAGGGRLRDLGDLAIQSPVLRILLFPLLMEQQFPFGDGRQFVNFNDIALHTFAGDYTFNRGKMNVARSEMTSDAGKFTATGTIDLPTEILDLIMTAEIGHKPLEMAITGTMTKPKARANIVKFLFDPTGWKNNR